MKICLIILNLLLAALNICLGIMNWGHWVSAISFVAVGLNLMSAVSIAIKGD